MAIFYFNHNKPAVAFFFNAFFTAVTFAVILVFNDRVDEYLKNMVIKENIKPFVKGSIHTILILVFTLILTYLFRLLFGWGDSMIG
tara:strand:+ start:281 stop:538 length:258 start_codon:yes stop_codon:yes gene_type:complete